MRSWTKGDSNCRKSLILWAAAMSCALGAFFAQRAPASDAGPYCDAVQTAFEQRFNRQRKGMDLIFQTHRLLFLQLEPYVLAECRSLPNKRLREKAVDLWRNVEDRRCQPMLVDKARRLQVTRRIGSVTWKGYAAEFSLWLIPLPGRVVLFGHPRTDGDTQRRNVLYKMHALELRVHNGMPDPQRQVYNRVNEERKWMGPDRWAYLAMQLFPSNSPRSSGFPEIKKEGEGFVVVLDGKQHDLTLPSSSQLEQRIGVPFWDYARPPPESKRIYLAIDWSEFLADPDRRKWLLKELHAALANVPSHWLVDEQVFLHTPTGVTTWRVEDLRNKRWPARLPQGHSRDMIGTLRSALRAVERKDSARLVFFTWNPPEDVDNGWRRILGGVGGENLRMLARTSDLQVIQVHGKRLTLFRTLAGERNYNIYEYRPNGPHVIQLPGIED